MRNLAFFLKSEIVIYRTLHSRLRDGTRESIDSLQTTSKTSLVQPKELNQDTNYEKDWQRWSKTRRRNKKETEIHASTTTS
jgi:hypothetical protein